MATMATNDNNNNERDLEIGAINPASTSAPAPGSYVTQMRAAQNPVRFELGDGNAEGARNKHATPPPPPSQPSRGMPSHYGIEGEPQCCLCSKIGRLFILTATLGIAALIMVYIYWTDIVKATESPQSHTQAFTSVSGINLNSDVTLNPRDSFLKDGKMNWGDICDKNKRSVIVMRRNPDSWKRQMVQNYDCHNGFGDLSSSFWLGRELLQNLTKGGKWDLRMDVKLDKETNFYAVYSKFFVSKEGQVYFFHFESETPKESNLGQKWKYISNSSSTLRLEAEKSTKDEEPLLNQKEVKIRPARWSWNNVDNANDTAKGEATGDATAEDSSKVANVEEIEDSSVPIGGTASTQNFNETDGADNGDGGKGDAAEDSKDAREEEEDDYDDSKEGSEVEDEVGASSRNKTSIPERKEEDDVSAQKKGYDKHRVHKQDDEAKMKENQMECHKMLVTYAFLYHCSCLECGGKAICPSELTLTLLYQ